MPQAKLRVVSFSQRLCSRPASRMLMSAALRFKGYCLATWRRSECIQTQTCIILEVDGSSWSRPDVTIWGMQNRLTANSGEFLELPAEELVFAQQEAEDLAKQVGRPTRVIGWAISRSRAESPNDEDLERQLHYQLVVDGHFVGLAVKPAQQKGAGLQSAMTAFRSVQQQADSSRLRQTPQDPVSHLSIEPLVTMLVEAWERQKKTTDDSERSPLCARASVRSFCRRFEGLSSLLQNEANNSLLSASEDPECLKVHVRAGPQSMFHRLQVLQLQSLAADLDHNAEVLSAVNQQMSSQDSPTWLPGRTPGAFRPEPLETRPHVQGGEASKSEEGAQGQSKRVRGPAVSAEAEIRWQDQPKANRGTQEHTSAPASSAGAIVAGLLEEAQSIATRPCNHLRSGDACFDYFWGPKRVGTFMLDPFVIRFKGADEENCGANRHHVFLSSNHVRLRLKTGNLVKLVVGPAVSNL
ncbi:unnamed protein product [Effrenium voratum]|nr:unnamed protein product [Effrenium voratum]